MNGSWIWLNDGQRTENERACFVRTFSLEKLPEHCEIKITAVTRYTLFCNGQVVGYGPVRAPKGTCCYDTYGLESLLHRGENLLAIQVWNYGWSTYQSLADDGGVCFEVLADGQPVAVSDTSVRATRDLGHLPYSPKRNVNLGFTDYYDARKFSNRWISEPEESAAWPAAAICEPRGTLVPRPIRPYHSVNQYPKRVVQVEDVEKGCQVLTVNTRRAFFGDRRDADETTMNALVGVMLESPKAQQGRISFPNRTWNGLIGTFRIGETVYPVADRQRDVAVDLPAGKSLFLLQLSGKFDDLYSHIEFRFPEDISLEGFGTDRCCFVVGPTNEVRSDVSGRGEIRDDMTPPNEAEQRLFACTTLEQLQASGAEIHWVPSQDVMLDQYLLSLERLAKVKRTYRLPEGNLGILWNNTDCTVVELPQCGDYRRILLDFGDMTIGHLNFTVCAEAGTVLDVYCFENSYRGEIDFTIGLNNGIRYICREGWQQYRAMTRIGARYVILSVHGNTRPVQIRDFHMEYRSFASSNSGSFQCDDYQLNYIWEMCAHTHQMCLEDSFTDSPTYEQTFWLGDAQTSALFNAYIFGDYSLTRRNLLLAPAAEANTPLFNALAPTDWNTSIPMWTMNWIISLVQYVENTGDWTVVDELYETVRRVMGYYESLMTEDGGFLVSAWNMIDWAPLDLPSRCVPAAYEALLSYCFSKVSAMAAHVNRAEDAAHFAEKARQTADYLNTTLWDEKRQAYRDGWSPEGGFSKTYSLQTHMLLYLYDVIQDPARRSVVLSYLLDKPEDFVDVGSPFALYYLYECWADGGRLDQLFDDVKARWGEMVRYETTTCWEVFPGFYENSRTRSYCHSWSAAPAMLMQKYLLGVRREDEGFHTVSVRFPETRCRWCRGTIPTPYGAILVDWNKDIRQYRLQIPRAIQVLREPPKEFEVTISYLD